MAAHTKKLSFLDYEIAPLSGRHVQSASLPSVEEMLHEISLQFTCFQSLPTSSPLRSFTQRVFAPESALLFVFSVNILEDHGTRDLESTRSALAAILDVNSNGINRKEMTKDQLKTIGTHTALEASYKFFAEQQSSLVASAGGGMSGSLPYNPIDPNTVLDADPTVSVGSLAEESSSASVSSDGTFRMLPLVATSDEIQHWHKLILPSAASHCFCANQQEVFTVRSSGEKFFYLNSGIVAAHMLNFFDTWFATMQELASYSPADLCTVLVKFAAWVLSRFLYIHPFSNGNGRIGRLLVQFILNYICPFPVPIACSREIYLQCIEQSQPFGSTLPDELASPAALAHLILSSVWRTWQSQNRATVTRNIEPATSMRLPQSSMDTQCC